MKCKLEEAQEQRFKKQIIYSVTRDYGAPQTALMMELRDDQTDLIYKYGNNPELRVPEKRFRVLSQSLTKEVDPRIIREYAHPSVLVSLFQSGKLNGCYKDELLDLMKYVGQLSEECSKDNPNPKRIIELTEKIASTGATMKKEVQP